MKCEHGELESRISDLENHLENVVKSLQMLKGQFVEKEGIIADLDRKLNELSDEFFLETASTLEKLSSCTSLENASRALENKETNTENSDCTEEAIAVEKDHQFENKSRRRIDTEEKFGFVTIKGFVKEIGLGDVIDKKLDFLSIMKRKISTQIKELE